MSLFDLVFDPLPADPPRAEPWMDDAACAEIATEMFFPEKGGSTRDAKKVCADCTVAAQCLDFAMRNDERFGIFGGLSERERRKLRRGPTAFQNARAGLIEQVRRQHASGLMDPEIADFLNVSVAKVRGIREFTLHLPANGSGGHRARVAVTAKVRKPRPPIDPTPVPGDFTHSLGGYTNHKCRCPICRGAHSDYQRRKKELQRDLRVDE